jgi:hypothetical protein
MICFAYHKQKGRYYVHYDRVHSPTGDKGRIPTDGDPSSAHFLPYGGFPVDASVFTIWLIYC